MKTRPAALVFVVALAGCSGFHTNYNNVDFMSNYEFVVFDRPASMGYELRIVSEDSRPICVFIEQWPLESKYLFEGAVVFITASEGQIIRAGTEAVTGYAPGRHYRIEPGETLLGFIPYSLFGDPEEIKALSAKQLNYAVNPVVCR